MGRGEQAGACYRREVVCGQGSVQAASLSDGDGYNVIDKRDGGKRRLRQKEARKAKRQDWKHGMPCSMQACDAKSEQCARPCKNRLHAAIVEGGPFPLPAFSICLVFVLVSLPFLLLLGLLFFTHTRHCLFPCPFNNNILE